MPQNQRKGRERKPIDNHGRSQCGFSRFLTNSANKHFMASIPRRPASKYWHAFFRDSEGRLIDKSTRLRDLKQARRVADILEMTAQRKKSAQHIRAAFARFSQFAGRKTFKRLDQPGHLGFAHAVFPKVGKGGQIPDPKQKCIDPA
jgi:hypothetical protein